MQKKFLFTIISIIWVTILTVTIDNSSAANNSENSEMINYKKNQNIVFLGDSIFDWYKTEKILDDFPVVNSGVAGNRTIDILENMEERVYVYNPTKVFILIGTNDIEWEYSDELNEEVYNNIIEIAKKIKENRKKSEIYIL